AKALGSTPALPLLPLAAKPVAAGAVEYPRRVAMRASAGRIRRWFLDSRQDIDLLAASTAERRTVGIVLHVGLIAMTTRAAQGRGHGGGTLQNALPCICTNSTEEMKLPRPEC